MGASTIEQNKEKKLYVICELEKYSLFALTLGLSIVIGMKRSLKESAITTAWRILSSSAWTRKLFEEAAAESFFGGIFKGTV